MPSGSTFTPVPGLITPATLRDENGVVLLDGNGYPISAEGFSIGDASSGDISVSGVTFTPVITLVVGAVTVSGQGQQGSGHGHHLTLGAQWDRERQERLLESLHHSVEAALEEPRRETVRAVIQQAAKAEKVLLTDLLAVPMPRRGDTGKTVEALKRLAAQITSLEKQIEAEQDDEEILHLLLH